MNATLKKQVSACACLSAILAASSMARAQTPTATTPARPARGPAAAANSNAISFREGGAQLPAYPVMVRDESPAAHADRVKWFHDARFGMFIHWGVYAVPGRGEWYMNQGKVPQATYKAFAKGFTAAKYDPQAWAALAKEAGMKYVVLTAKHHDGFTLYDSAVSDWNAVKSSGAKRDLIQPLADAVRAQGIKFGLYYSQSQDWTNLGGGTGNTQPWDENQKKGDFDEYMKNIALAQVHEILDKYHPSYLFFDTEYSMTPERVKPIFDLTCQYPELVINNRLGGGVLGDTATPEQRIATDPLGRGFEVCMTINNSWGYNASDTRWKTAQQLIRNLSDIAAKGGNYLLNIGPMADGTIPAPEVERLQAMGKWMKTNGEAIYATEAGPLYPLPAWGRSTMKANAKGGTTLYVHVWNWPADGKVLLAGVKQPALSGRLLAGGAAVSSAMTAEGLVLMLPGAAPDPDVSIVAVEFADPLHIALGAATAQSGFTGTPMDPSGGRPQP